MGKTSVDRHLDFAYRGLADKKRKLQEQIAGIEAEMARTQRAIDALVGPAPAQEKKEPAE